MKKKKESSGTFSFYCEEKLHSAAVQHAKDKYDRPISWLITKLLKNELGLTLPMAEDRGFSGN